jgi:hypothetical protein
MDIILSKDEDICYLLSKKNSQEQVFHLVVGFLLRVQGSESEFSLFFTGTAIPNLDFNLFRNIKPMAPLTLPVILKGRYCGYVRGLTHKMKPVSKLHHLLIQFDKDILTSISNQHVIQPSPHIPNPYTFTSS